MVVPFAAGGPIDVVARIISPRMSELLGQQLVVDNMPGAGGMVGASRVAKAAPDGYTFLLGNQATHTYSQFIYKKPLYNAVTDFAPGGLVVSNTKVLVVRKDLPVDTLAEFIAYAKANQAKMQYGSAGGGSATHIACVLLNARIGHQHHPRALSRRRTGDAGPDGGAHRLHVRRGLDRACRRSAAER